MLNKPIINKLYQYFKERLGMYVYRRGWMKGNCPECGKHKFGVNLSANKVHCFSCEYRAKPVDVIISLEGLETREKVYLFLKTFEGLTYLEPKQIIHELKAAKLPESYTLINLGKGLIADNARSYWNNRGFDIYESAVRGIGYCTRGPYAYRIIIPYYEAGKLVYFTARQFYNIGEKFKNPTLEELGLGKSLLIYNVDALAIYNKTNVLESATNSLTLGDNSLALGGKSASSYQLNKLLKAPCKRYAIILDPDAYTEALKLGMTLSFHKEVKVVKLPDGTDVNTLGKKATMKIMKETPYMNYLQLKRELTNHSLSI